MDRVIFELKKTPAKAFNFASWRTIMDQGCQRFLGMGFDQWRSHYSKKVVGAWPEEQTGDIIFYFMITIEEI